MADSSMINSRLESGHSLYDKETGRIKLQPEIGKFDKGQKILEAYKLGEEARLTKPQEKIEKIDERSEALAELKEAVQNFNAESTKLIRANDSIGIPGVFDLTTPTYQSAGGNPGSDYFIVNPEAGRSPTQFAFEVNKLAEKDSVSATTTVADRTTALGLDMTVTFTNPDPDVDVVIEPTDSASDICHKIFAVRKETGVEAELVPSGSEYLIFFNAVNESEPVNFTTVVNAGDPTQLPSTSARTVVSLQAEVTYRGETSLHDSNTVSINGLTFELKQATPGPVNVSTDYSPELVLEHVLSWNSAHNDVVDLINKYVRNTDTADQNNASVDEINMPLLARNRLALDIERFFVSEISGPVSGLNNESYNALSNVGFQTSRSGRLDLNSVTLKDKLSENFEGVKKLFTFESTSSNPNLTINRNPTTIDRALMQYDSGSDSFNSFTLTVSRDGAGNLSANLTDAFGLRGVVNLSPEVTEPDGTVLSTFRESAEGIGVIVRDPGPYHGFRFFVNEMIPNGASTNSTFQISQGVGNKSYKFTDGILESSTEAQMFPPGTTFRTANESFNEEKSRVEGKMDRIKDQSSRKMAMLERKLMKTYESLAKIEQINTQLKQLEIQAKLS